MEQTTHKIILGLALLFGLPSPAQAQSTGGQASLSTRMVRSTALIPMARPRVIKRRPVKQPLPRRKVGWGSGEHMTYRVSLAGVWGGRAAMSVGKVEGKGSRASLRIRGMGETVPFISAIRHMREDLTTSVRLKDLRPLSQVADRKAPNKDRLLKTTFGADLKQLLTHQGKTYRRTRRVTGNSSLLDPITALFALRSVKLNKGKAFNMRVVNGTSLMQVEARVTGRERIFIDGKAHDTWRIEGTGQKIRDDGTPWPDKAPRHLAIWFSSDRAQVPVRVEGDTRFGKVVALLSSYKASRRGLRVGVAAMAGGG